MVPWTHFDLVSGTIEWFNIQYDGEEVLTLNLYTDIDDGDLDIIATKIIFSSVVHYYLRYVYLTS